MQYDILIIGAGFAGVATAYGLMQRSGLKVLLLERESSFGMHASGRNAALLRQAVAFPETARWIQQTLAFLQNPPFASTPGLFRPTGSVLLGRKALLGDFQRILANLSAHAHLYGPQQMPPELPTPLAELLEQSSYEALLYTPQDGVVDIHAYLQGLVQVVRQAGVEFRFGTPVTQLSHRSGEWVVHSHSAQYRARILVNAAGAWAAPLGQMAGAAIPEMLPLRRHLYISQPFPQAASDWPYVWNVEEEFYFRPESEGLLLCPGDEDPHPPQEPATDPRAMELLAEKLQNHFSPLAGLAVRQGWACLRTKRQDGRFHLGWDSQAPNYFWVAALGGHGMSASLGVGQEASGAILSSLSGDLLEN